MTGYINLVKFDKNGYPACEKHGVMLCVNESRTLWRCPTCNIGVSFDSSEELDKWLKLHDVKK